MSETVLLFGGGGILGSGFREALARRPVEVVWAQPHWGVPESPAAIASSLLARAEGNVTVVWAAGLGHAGADWETMRAETAAIAALCRTIKSLPVRRQAKVSLIAASSAGAIFADHGAREVNEDDSPSPVSPYGWEKVAQEELLRGLGSETGGRVLICRYTNLYGLASGRVTKRGLVSTAVRAVRLREPMVIYVDPDTRRDLLYNVDAAAMSLWLARSGTGTTTAIVGAGETRTVIDVLSLVGRVFGRRVPATYAERPETRIQPKALRFRRPPARLAREVRSTPMEVALHLMLRAPLAA